MCSFSINIFNIMLNNLSNIASKLSVLKLAIIVLFAFIFNLAASEWLNASYIESKFPVPYYEAQLSFDHLKLKAWYAFLISKGTLSNYVQTQHIDFVFIVSVLFLHFFALLFVAKLIPSTVKWHQLTLMAALLSTIAPLSDALENVVSYLMLSNPLNFSSYLALIYSSFAATKFAFFVFAYVAAIAGIAVVLYFGVMARFRLKA
jgi:hypothetical protein